MAISMSGVYSPLSSRERIFDSGFGRRIAYGQELAFRSDVVRRFIGADFDNERKVGCFGDQAGDWESFRIYVGHMAHPPRFLKRTVAFGDYISLQVSATYRGNERWNLRYDRDESRSVYADVHHVDRWETFVLLPKG